MVEMIMQHLLESKYRNRNAIVFASRKYSYVKGTVALVSLQNLHHQAMNCTSTSIVTTRLITLVSSSLMRL